MSLEVPSLADEVITLRPPAARDVDAITDACQDADIPRFTRVPSPYSRDHAVEHVRDTEEHWADGSSAVFVMTDTATDLLLGSIGLLHLTEDRGKAEIGYWVAREARRQGIATRAVRLVSRWAVLDLGIQRLELMTRPDNVASQGVATGAGFTREGLLRSYTTLAHGLSDIVMFSLVPGDLAPTPG